MTTTRKMDYQSFLFSCLLRAVNKTYDKLPYDLMFKEHLGLLEEFLESDYNDKNRSEHDCMYDFLKDTDVESIKGHHNEQKIKIR